MGAPLPRMYTDIADWWPLLSCPQDYAEEAEIFRRTLLAVSPFIQTVLELGSGGGNNASHLKQHFDMTLVDLSPGMLATSKRINPELPHHQGDMRTARLNQTFDAVFIHDAVMYMTTEKDLLQAMQTAAVHLKPGSPVLIVPDCVKETYRPQTDHGGHDGEDIAPEYTGRSLRYLEWLYDPDPNDSQYITEFVYLLRSSDGSVQTLYDRHIDGLFPRKTWQNLMHEAGFEVRLLPFEHSEVEPGMTEMILGIKLGK